MFDNKKIDFSKTLNKEELNKKINESQKYFENENFSGENFDRNLFKDITFYNCSFQKSNLNSCKFNNCNFINCDISYSNISDCIFNNVKIQGTKLIWAITNDTIGFEVRCVQMNTSRGNNVLSYFVDLGIWTTGCFQGTKQELLEKVKIRHEYNDKLSNKYIKSIEFLEGL